MPDDTMPRTEVTPSHRWPGDLTRVPYPQRLVEIGERLLRRRLAVADVLDREEAHAVPVRDRPL